MQRVFSFALALILILAANLAGAMRDRLWNEYVRFTSPFVQQPPVGEPVTQHTRRLIVVVVRGLTERAAASMPALNTLRARGASVTLDLEPPTYQLPLWITLFTGATQPIHGTLTNASPRNPEIDSVFSRLSAVNQSSVIIGSAPWNDLYGTAATRVEVIETDNPAFQDEQALVSLLQTLRDPAAQERLIVVELALLNAMSREPLDTGPDSGLQRSPLPEATASAVAALDIRLNAIAQAADLANNTVIVVSDRGVNTQGRDGGGEPEIARVPMVMAGAGIVFQKQLLARNIDVAPTLSLLLGLPPPLQSQGAPLWDAIASDALLASARQLTAFYESWAEVARQPRFAAETLRAFESDIAAGKRERYGVWLAVLNQAATDAREAKLDAERRARLPLTIALAVVGLALAGVALNNRLAPTLFGCALYAAAWYADFNLLRRFSASLTQFIDADPAVFYRTMALDSAIALGVCCVVVAIIAARVSESLSETLLAVASVPALIAIANGISYLAFYWRWGNSFTWTVPDSAALVNALIALNQIAALNVRITSALPDVPIIVPALLVAGLAWVLLGRREE